MQGIEMLSIIFSYHYTQKIEVNQKEICFNKTNTWKSNNSLRIGDEIKEEMIPAFINEYIHDLTEIVNHKR